MSCIATCHPIPRLTRVLTRLPFIGLFWLLLSLPAQTLADVQEMSSAARELLADLSTDLRQRANYALQTDEHLRWHFVPDELFPRNGVALKELNTEQQQLARRLLQTGLSQRGYLTASAIMELERVLLATEANGRFARDNENYRVTVFGEPDAEGTWAWRFEGHHLSLHFQVVDGEITVSTPSFFGSNPAHVTTGAQTPAQENQRVLADREDAGRALITSLDAEQLDSALLPDAAPRDIVTGNKYPIQPLAAVGIRADQLGTSQQLLLRHLITVYTADMNDEIAELRWQKIEQGGIDNISFAWAGALLEGEAHYYRVQGPSFLIEYDNVQNGANHVHSVWRDFEGDFGADLLRQHHADFDHR